MGYPTIRMRRLRKTPALRKFAAETSLTAAHFMFPLFVCPGKGIKEEISSLPGQYRFSVDTLFDECRELEDLGIPGVLLFGIPESKDEIGSGAYMDDGIIQQAVQNLKEKGSKLLIATDVCLCEYTSHGHCGIIKDGEVNNDLTLPLVARQALSHARSGADLVAPSDMMDGRVGVIRQTLDKAGFQDVPIMAYSAKYASSFYGPFRDAAGSAPQFGDRQSYQMPAGNAREALREVSLDIEEGADIVMVKPALAYLDIIYRVKQTVSVPVAAYNVSGEYACVKAAGRDGFGDPEKMMWEILYAIKRAGADIIITYFAKEAARGLKER